jgi:hypothetical protein
MFSSLNRAKDLTFVMCLTSAACLNTSSCKAQQTLSFKITEFATINQAIRIGMELSKAVWTFSFKAH